MYIMVKRFKTVLTVAATREVGERHGCRLQKYYLLYAETPTVRRRVTISAAVACIQQDSMFQGPDSPNVIEPFNTSLPGDLASQLELLLRGMKLSSLVTNVSLNLLEHTMGEVEIDQKSIRVAQDFHEGAISDSERRFLRDIEHLGCPKFWQGDVIVHSRNSPYAFRVELHSRLFTEQRMPFAGAGLSVTDATEHFFNDIRRLCSVRGCDGVARFAGVVTEDATKRVVSYMYEAPALGRLSILINHAQVKQQRIPWSIREMWARQIVAALSELHRRNVVAGKLGLFDVGIDANGNAVLSSVRTSGICLWNRKGNMPPELRSEQEIQPLNRGTNFETDLFQLGHILWLLAEHVSNHGNFSYCPRNACTNGLFSCCTAEHINPIELPLCTDPEVPLYMNVCINRCRQSEPSSRLPAEALLSLFPNNIQPPDLAPWLKYWAASDLKPVNVFCDEWGALTLQERYHCNTCTYGDFDLCKDCVSREVHCWVPVHQLVRRGFKNGSVITIG